MTNMTVDQLFARGNDYAAAKQWSSALWPFRTAIGMLYDEIIKQDACTSVPSAELERALQVLVANPDDLEVVSMDLAPELITELRTTLETCFPDIDATQFVSAFPVDTQADTWTLVFCNQDTVPLGKGDEQVTIRYPRAPAFSFVVRLHGEAADLYHLSGSYLARISYAWAHLGQAATIAAMTQYYVDQVLDVTGRPLIMDQARLYWNALLLEPKNAWALAHLAEVYRAFANGWWPDENSGQIDLRKVLKDYIKALVYFQTSLECNPSSFWTNAHMGAAIVNTRAFVDWRDNSAVKDLAYRLGLHPDSEEYDAPFLTLAVKLFVNAQQLQGFFYPWCMVYYGGALTLQAMFLEDDDPSNRAEVATLSRIVGMQAFYLQPTLLHDVFDPRWLIVNVIMSIGTINLSHGDYLLAWQYTWISMKWMFDFHFLAGAQALVACQVLAITSYKLLDKGPPPVALIESSGLEHTGDPNDFPIQPQPITNPQDLCTFIEDAFNRFGAPVVTPCLEPNVQLSTKLSMGLLSIHDTLYMFIWIIARIVPEHAGLRSLEDAYQRLSEKLGVSDALPDPTQDPWPDQSDAGIHSLHCKITTGRPNFESCKRLLDK